MTPEQEEQVARVLAETARQEPAGPAPDHVAARLDQVLAELQSPRVRAASPAAGRPVESPSAARRRHRSRMLLAAACTLAVIALGGVSVATDGFGALSGGSTASSTTAGGAASADRPLATAREVPRLRSARLEADVARVVGALPSGPPAAGVGGPEDACRRPSTSRGQRLLAVRLDGRPASLVVGPRRDGSRRVEVFTCADPSTPEATVDVSGR